LGELFAQDLLAIYMSLLKNYSFLIFIPIYLQGNSSTSKEVSTNGTITTVKPDSNTTTAALSWKNVMNIFNVFDFRVSFALVRENLGTLLSVS